MKERDSLRTQSTPEGVDIELHTAGPPVRLLAFLIDGMIRLLLLIPLLIFISMTEESGTWLFLLLFFLIQWFYFTLFEGAMDGQTPGKRAMNIRVIRDNGTSLTWNASIIRNLLRAADGFLLNYVVGLAVMCCSDGFRRIGDHAASTIVVYVKPHLPAAAAVPLEVRPAVPPVELTIAEQQSILAFADRRPYLSEERARELAEILERSAPSLLPPGTASPQMRLTALAAWIRGGRTEER